MTHEEYVKKLNKRELQDVLVAARQRLVELGRQKKQHVEELSAKMYSKEPVELFGQDVYVMSYSRTMEGFGDFSTYKFYMSNGSVICINLDKEDA